MQTIKKLTNILIILAFTNLSPISLLLHFSPAAYLLSQMLLITLFVFINIDPLWNAKCFTRLGIMLGGGALIEIFGVAATVNTVLSVIYGFKLLFSIMPLHSYIIYILTWLFWCALLALNGCIRVYATSVQLGIKWRVLFLLLWWMPVVNIVLMVKICRLVHGEYNFETEKAALNAARKENESCMTKYPLLMVHGVFFRDIKMFNYWGRVPAELQRNGATVYYGMQNSAASIENSGKELRDRVLSIVEKTGCEKVNIIAHSKGGLDSRYAITRLGLAPYVASLTTINTPHRGCAFAEWLLKKIPVWLRNRITNGYNNAMKRLGDTSPDFYGAVCDLTASSCEAFNQNTPDVPGVLYQSIGSKMRNRLSAPFPQNFTHPLVRHFDNDNDGLVGVESMKWGESFRMLTSPGLRGISHGDMIDLNRQNIKGFDVREFYVDLVRDLKSRGL